jgi:hypothetical protein
VTDLSIFTTQARKVPYCGVTLTLKRLDEENPEAAEMLRQVLAHPDVVFSQVEKYSEEMFGSRISAVTVSRHIKRKCTCG